MKQVVRAAVAAVALLTGLTAQAALVKFRVTGLVTESWTFDDGTTVPAETPVVISYTYETRQASTSLDRREDGSGYAVYDIMSPYHFKLRVGHHRVRAAAGYRATLTNDLNAPFGDTFELETLGGAYVDGTLLAGGKLTLSLLSNPGSTGALHSLRLPKHLKEWSFDAFRVGHLWRDANQPLLSFAITGVKSSVCAEAIPGTDECAADD